MKIEELKSKLEMIIDTYVDLFRLKHELSYMGWVANEVGGIVCLGDYFFNFDEIRIDLENNVPKGKIFEWYDYNLEKLDNKLNYRNWLLKNKD